MPNTYSRFHDFVSHIGQLPVNQPLAKHHLLVPELLLCREAETEIYYPPFDYINCKAKIVLIGMTPGWTQRQISYRRALQGVHDGLSHTEICKQACREASFAGLMRKTLISMLDGMNIPQLLGIKSSGSLFTDDSDLLQTTSAIRYPVFIRGQNYSGHNPPIFKTPILRHPVDNILSEELRETTQALFIPFGRSVSTVMENFITSGQLDPEQRLLDFPHPSGANVNRLSQYLKMRSSFARTALKWLERSRILNRVSR